MDLSSKRQTSNEEGTLPSGPDIIPPVSGPLILLTRTRYDGAMNMTTDTQRLRLTVLGSGSKGNATVIEGPEGALVVDAGFSAKEMLRRMEIANVDPTRIRAILVTHEHGDHISGVGVLSRRLGVPVFASHGTAADNRFSVRVDEISTFSCGEVLTLAGIDIVPFHTSHDAAEPVGFRFALGDDVIGYATDTGHLTEESAEALEGCRLLALESNHDLQMLRTGPYPYFLKDRVASQRGHLSNEQASNALERLVSDRLELVMGMHLSETNNLPLLSTAALTARLADLCHSATVTVAGQNRPVQVA